MKCTPTIKIGHRGNAKAAGVTDVRGKNGALISACRVTTTASNTGIFDKTFDITFS